MWQRQRLRTWVKPGDRKLLQSSSFKQDGSGNLKTVAKAITSTGKRYGSGRYIIYVKAGTYKENIKISTKLMNIMLLGDGIGKNIITGSKTIGVGATTFKSPLLVTDLPKIVETSFRGLLRFKLEPSRWVTLPERGLELGFKELFRLSL
ncbi:pectinesterase 2-like protein, partial [Tanacetum coccineum]